MQTEKGPELEEKLVGLEEHRCGTGVLREGEIVGEDKSSKHANICRAGSLAGRIFLQSSLKPPGLVRRRGGLLGHAAPCSLPALF